MSPQMLILPESGSNIDQFLAEHYNFQKNIGPVEDSMDVSSCGPLATTCASSFQHAFIGDSAVLQWSDVRLTSTRGTIGP
jgi:hypothetical protein